jgi:ABC-type antimicrobial peptide transport system permease subunit
MGKNYLLVAWRNLQKNKAFSFLNISGLAIGMASAILILLWVQNEVSYDRFHKNKDFIYEAWNRGKMDDKIQCWNTTPQILGLTLKKDYPEVQMMARTVKTWKVTSVGDRKFSSESMIVDPDFLKIFSFHFTQGNGNNALESPSAVVITRAMAKKMFGNQDPMNKVLRIDTMNYVVSGILDDLPSNTRFSFDYLVNWNMIKTLGWEDAVWANNFVNTFLLLKPETNPEIFNNKIRTISQVHSKGVVKEEVFLHPLSKWRLYSGFENGRATGGEIETVRMFMIIAAFILLIACINFMNLSTARSEKRAKEVGIRKVSGAVKSALVIQFLGESLLISAISGIFGLLLVQLFLPSFNLMIGKSLTLPYTNIYFWFYALLFVLLTGLLAGSYPAFFLSSFKPVSVLKGKFKNAQSLVTPRRVLVVLQFSFAIVLIISTLVVVQQIKYAQQRDSGYNRDQILYHYMTGTLTKRYPSMKSELLQSGVVSMVNRTSWPLTQIWSDTWDLVWQGKSPYDKTDFDRFSADENLIKLAGLKLIQGRDMDPVKYPTDSTAALLNESAVKTMGFKNPIGQLVTDDQKTYHIVGVVKNFILTSPYDPVKPMMIEGAGSNSGFNVVNMKLADGINMQSGMHKIEQILKKYNPDYPFEYHFVDQDYAKKFDDTQRTATLSALFAGLTILISCLGLFGLASFMAVQRNKEIGVRKVLGATVINLWRLLSKDFVVLVLVSICIAIPAAYYFMNNWLAQFQYRTGLSWWIFAAAGLGALTITLITVSFQSIKAALANPVNSLRSE